jgi:hypothetical protein
MTSLFFESLLDVSYHISDYTVSVYLSMILEPMDFRNRWLQVAY